VVYISVLCMTMALQASESGAKVEREISFILIIEGKNTFHLLLLLLRKVERKIDEKPGSGKVKSSCCIHWAAAAGDWREHD
jgi:hypothetical protein